MTKTFENQNALPRLPIPTLEESAARYLKSVRPFLSPKDLNAYTTIVNDFVNGQGQELQKRLNAYDSTQPHSWLENWWLALAYLSWRESVLVNSNWYIIVQKHPAHGQPNHQIKRAAGFISNFLTFKESLDEYDACYFFDDALEKRWHPRRPRRGHYACTNIHVFLESLVFLSLDVTFS